MMVLAALCQSELRFSYDFKDFATCARKRFGCVIALAETSGKVDLSVLEIFIKGTKSCLTKLGFLRQQPLSHWLAVWIQICNVVQWVQQLVRLPQISLAQIKLQQHLPVQQLACCVTTQASAARHAKLSRAILAASDYHEQPSGFAPAAVFRSKDRPHV